MFIKGSTITTNIFRVQAYDSAMRRYFYNRSFDFMLKGKGLADFPNLFSLKTYKDK